MDDPAVDPSSGVGLWQGKWVFTLDVLLCQEMYKAQSHMGEDIYMKMERGILTMQTM